MPWLGQPALAAWCPSGPPVRRGRPSGFEISRANSGALVIGAPTSTRIEGRPGRCLPDPTTKRPGKRSVHEEGRRG